MSRIPFLLSGLNGAEDAANPVSEERSSGKSCGTARNQGEEFLTCGADMDLQETWCRTLDQQDVEKKTKKNPKKKPEDGA
jgi:hypothetical protein